MDEFFRLSDDWEGIREKEELVPYGTGRIGRRVIPTLMKEFKIPFLIDNSGREDEVFGLKVLRLQEAEEYLKKKKCKIVVTTVSASYQEMGQQLKDIGLEEYKDFCIFERFALEWNLRWKNKCVLSKIDTVITTRCTLKCKNCNMFISHMTDQHDLDLSELKKNFDTFFESVDYVYEYTLLGGEPFLHKNIKEILTYMGERYGTRIGKINLISNGTVVPAEEVLEVMEKYQVMVNISDYTHVVPYEDKLNKVERVFESHGIEYYVIPNNTWKDVLYPSCEYHTDNPKEHMRLCGHGTHSVDGGKLYWCDPAFSAERFLGFAAREDDSLDLDLNQNNHSKFDASLNIIKYILGDVNERGYMTICTKCAGVGWDNDNIVTAGIQK